MTSDTTPILIVDDEADLRVLLVEALQDLGYEAHGAESGAAALDLASRTHFPVIFTDLNMPGGLSGLDLIKRLHEVDPKSFPILMTGYATTEAAIEALKSGAYDFITKPFKFAEIEVALGRALSHYQALRDNEVYQRDLERLVEERTKETVKLKDDIERLFEGFVDASVTAIEARDPTTSGHSHRVAELTVGLAEAVNLTPSGIWGAFRLTDRQMRELRYASLLHDFGKVGVREQVLVKAKKLEDTRVEMLLQRLHQRGLEDAVERMLAAWREGQPFDARIVAAVRAEAQEEVRRFIELVQRSNEPSVLPKEAAEELAHLDSLAFEHWSGDRKPVAEARDLDALRIPKGSLTEEERREVESHVTHTFRFLEKIPWTEELADLPTIAYAHHERLNGRGYPRKLTGDAIPPQSKMMAIADVFDALAAADRPYKVAVPVGKALDILHEEAKAGLMDPELLKIFIEAKVYERTAKGK
ncbi:MAG TPA: HD domain-containing phosphohydrolase [Holophagaceae bacterium]|nr:HD domain-containing phosphohydrolase [Holophagaceae bacterium]